MRKMEGAAAQWALRNAQSSDTLQTLMFSRSEAEFFTKLPDIDEQIDVVTYIAAEGDIS